MRYVLALCAAVLALGTIPAAAHHPNAVCVLPEEVLDDVSERLPVELKMAKVNRENALDYIAAMFKVGGGGKPPFDLAAVKGGVIIFSAGWPQVYVGVIDGPNGEICHARAIPLPMHKAILNELRKLRA